MCCFSEENQRKFHAGGSVNSKRIHNPAGVWMPMERAAKKDWSWVDWMRFLFYRHAQWHSSSIMSPAWHTPAGQSHGV